MSSRMIRLLRSHLSTVMAGLGRLGPGIHVFFAASKSWMAGTSRTSPAMTAFRRLALIAAIILAAPLDNAHAQQRPTRLEIWDLKLGTAATALPDEFTDYACGTNGGPPSMALS